MESEHKPIVSPPLPEVPANRLCRYCGAYLYYLKFPYSHYCGKLCKDRADRKRRMQRIDPDWLPMSERPKKEQREARKELRRLAWAKQAKRRRALVRVPIVAKVKRRKLAREVKREAIAAAYLSLRQVQRARREARRALKTAPGPREHTGK